MKSNMGLSTVGLLVSVALLCAGCAGRTPNPVSMFQPGDNTLSCAGLEMVMSNCEQEIASLLPKSDKTGSNVALGVAGAFLIVPLFFMDFSEADKVELEAWRRRYNHLVVIYELLSYVVDGAHDQAATFSLIPSMNRTPRMTSGMS